MCRKPIRLGVVALALTASAAAQNSALPQDNASAQSNASSQTKARPTPAQLDQPGAVVMAPPFVAADQPLFGALNLQGQAPQRPLGEQPPAMQPAPNEAAAIGSGGGEAGAPSQGHD